MALRWLWRLRLLGLLVFLLLVLLLTLKDTHSTHSTHELRPTVDRSDQRKHILSPHIHHVPKHPSTGRPVWNRARPPVVFLKTHRTGAGTVQNILFRLGERERATFAFPTHTYHFNYPDSFRADLVEDLPPGSSQFDLLCSSMRLDLSQLRKVMPPNTLFITLLRDPVHTFESVFSLHSSSVPAFLRAKRAAGGDGTALQLFLDQPEAFWEPKEPGNGLAKNPMSFDLGLDSLGRDGPWLEQLSRLEEAFDLVMIAEHFEESLVLMGALLGLSRDELAHLPLNTRARGSVTPLDERSRAKVRSWNVLDSLLYDFFLRVFWERAARFGLGRLREEASQLKMVSEQAQGRCVSGEGRPPGRLKELLLPRQGDSATVLGFEPRDDLSLEQRDACIRMMLPELQYSTLLYFRQYGRDMRAAPAH